jgi:hypothetical protein
VNCSVYAWKNGRGYRVISCVKYFQKPFNWSAYIVEIVISRIYTPVICMTAFAYPVLSIIWTRMRSTVFARPISTCGGLSLAEISVFCELKKTSNSFPALVTNWIEDQIG